MASIRKKGQNWFYRFVDGEGKQRERKGCPDRRETERMAAAAETEAANIRRGFIDPKARGYRDHDARPIDGHLADWHADMLGRGSTPDHADLSRARADRIVRHSRIGRIADLTPSRVQASLKAVRDEGASLRTVHHYMRVIKAFGKWLWRDGRAREDVLVHLTSQNPDADKRRERRAFMPEAQAGLIRAAELGPVVFNATGPDRAPFIGSPSGRVSGQTNSGP